MNKPGRGDGEESTRETEDRQSVRADSERLDGGGLVRADERLPTGNGNGGPLVPAADAPATSNGAPPRGDRHTVHWLVAIIILLVVIVALLAVIIFMGRSFGDSSRPSASSSSASPTTTTQLPSPPRSSSPSTSLSDSPTSGSTVETDSPSAGSAPGRDGDARLLNELTTPTSSPVYSWQATNLNGAPTEGMATHIWACSTDAIKESDYFKPPGFNRFVATVGATDSSSPKTRIRFEVLLDNAVQTSEVVVVTKFETKEYIVQLDGSRSQNLQIKATLLDPPNTSCDGSGATVVWGEAQIQVR